MARHEKKFVFETPIFYGGYNGDKTRVNIRIEGVGYCYPNNEPQDMYDYDIDTVEADGQNFTNAYRLLAHDQDSRLVDTIHEATMAHMSYLFSPAYVACDMCEREPDQSYGVIMMAKMEDDVTVIDPVDIVSPVLKNHDQNLAA